MTSHAGHDDLVKFIKDCSPNNVILCHGENREALLEDLANYNVILPFNGKEFTV